MAPDIVGIAALIGDQFRGEALSVFMADQAPIVASRGHCRFAVSDFDEPWSKSFRAPAAREWLSLEWPRESHQREGHGSPPHKGLKIKGNSNSNQKRVRFSTVSWTTRIATNLS
jgi:hypothetical protein